MRNITIKSFVIILAIFSFISSLTFPKASQIQPYNFTSDFFTISEDGTRSIFSNYSVRHIQDSNALMNNITLKVWEINNQQFKEVGYHIYQFSTFFEINELFWIGQKVVLLGRQNQYFITKVLSDGLLSKAKDKKIPNITWFRGSILRLNSQKKLTFFVLRAIFYPQLYKYDIFKISQLSLVNESIAISHQCSLSKTYRVSDYFHSVFLLNKYYCVALAYQNTTQLIIQCCSSKTNVSIVAKFNHLTSFKSQFRIASIHQTYSAYLVYQNAFIHKITLDSSNKQFKLKSLNYYISKNVDGAFFINKNLVDIHKDSQYKKLILSFYFQNDNQIQAYQRLIVDAPTINQGQSLQFIDRNRFQIFSNQTAFIFSQLQLTYSPYFCVKFVRQQKQFIGIIILLGFLAFMFFFSFIYCIKFLSFTRIKLILSLSISEILIQILCYIMAFFFIFLKVIATNTDKINYENSSTLGDQTLSGSFWLRLLEKIFIFCSIIIPINQLKPQFDYSHLYMQNHIRHGLKANCFISLIFFKLIFKSTAISIISFTYVFLLQQNYSNLPDKTFHIDIDILCAITACTIAIISFALLAKLLSKIIKSYYKTLSILFVLTFGLNIWSDLFYRNDKIINLDYFFIFTWIPSLFKSYIQLIYQAELRFINPRISQIQMEYLFIFHFLMLSFLYIAYIKWVERKSKIDGLIDSQKIKQQNSNINLSGSDQSSFYKDRLETGSSYFESQLLNVYIPVKINLKNRQQKNKVLEDIRFVGRRGEVLSFIDEKNESRAALFKILTGQQKSDQVIELGLVGKVSYSERVKVSYCLDYQLSFPQLTVMEHLQFYYWLKKPSASRSQMKSQVLHILDQFQISDDFRVKKAKQLSGGYLKKMCLACAFVGNPDVIILDEPTLGLDIKFQKFFQQKIQIWKQNKLLIIFTTNIDEADALSDKIWFFQNQRIRKYEQAKRKYQKIQIKLQFLAQNTFVNFSPIVQQFAKETFAKTSPIITNQVKKWVITIDKPYKQGTNAKIKQFMKKVTQMNVPKYLCHFDYRMLSISLTHLDLLDKYSDSEGFCKNCDGIHLYEHLKGEQIITNNYLQNISIGENIAVRQQKKAENILSLLSEQSIKTNIWVSQIKSILYRRWKLSKVFSGQKGQIFFAQVSLWANWFAVSTQSELHIKDRLIYFCLLYFILHMQTVQLYTKERQFGHYDYYKSIGLYWVYYLTANFIYDFFQLLIPLAAANIICYQFQNFGIINYFGSQLQHSLMSCFLLALSFSLFQIFLSLIFPSTTQKHSLLFTILLFPFILQFDPYFASFNSQQLGYGYLSYFFFPWSANQILHFNTIYYFFIIAQIFIMVILIFLVEKHREYYKQKEGDSYLRNFQHSNSEETVEARRYVEQIQEKSKFVTGVDIVKFYGDKVSLRNVSFFVKEGEILGVFGHNGSGKTTLFKIIVRRLTQSSGVILYFGKRRQQLNLMKKLQVSYCPQMDHFDPNLSLQQNLIIIGKIKGLQRKYLSKFIAVFLGYLGLKGNQEVPVKDLSVSERKKAHFAAAFLGFPKLIVCDQISTGIDKENNSKIMALLRAYSSIHKKCIILTSHNINEGEEFCDRIMLLKNGILKASNTAFRLRMDASQQLYKIIIFFKREDNQILRSRKKQKIILFFKGIQYKKCVFEDQYCLIYSIDLKEQIGNIFESLFNICLQGFIDKFSFYKHGLQEFCKTYMTNSDNKNQE